MGDERGTKRRRQLDRRRGGSTRPGGGGADPARMALDGRYAIERIIGRGGSGVVVRAHDRDLSQVVAIKIVRAELAGQRVWATRLAREVRLARRSATERLPRVRFSAGGRTRLPGDGAGEGDAAGRDPGASRRPRRRTGSRRARGDLGAGRDHAAGYRAPGSLPRTLLRLDDGRLALSDFGLATDVNESTSVHGGTIAYMAPEVMRGRPLEHRLRHLVAGRVDLRDRLRRQAALVGRRVAGDPDARARAQADGRGEGGAGREPRLTIRIRRSGSGAAAAERMLVEPAGGASRGSRRAAGRPSGPGGWRCSRPPRRSPWASPGRDGRGRRRARPRGDPRIARDRPYRRGGRLDRAFDSARRDARPDHLHAPAPHHERSASSGARRHGRRTSTRRREAGRVPLVPSAYAGLPGPGAHGKRLVFQGHAKDGRALFFSGAPRMVTTPSRSCRLPSRRCRWSRPGSATGRCSLMTWTSIRRRLLDGASPGHDRARLNVQHYVTLFRTSMLDAVLVTGVFDGGETEVTRVEPPWLQEGERFRVGEPCSWTSGLTGSSCTAWGA